ncbi:MAG: OmpA family protein [candidate division NC10 bacterium]|nr:OmpA family protein [candidate division NC10 bacterium]
MIWMPITERERGGHGGLGRAAAAGLVLLLVVGCAPQSELTAREQALELTRRQLTRAEEEGKALARRVEALERAVADLTAARTQLEGQRAELSATVEKLQGENRELHQALRARADEQAKRISELIGRNRVLEVEVARLGLLQGELQRAQEARAAVEREVGRLKTALEQQQAEVARLTQETRTLEERAAQIAREKEAEIAKLTATYDNLVKDLKKEIEAGEIQVTQYRDLLTVNLVDKILFDSGRTEIKPRGLEVLQRVGDILKGVGGKEIRIEGHTDNVPIGAALAQRFPTNWELSTARATTVARFLQERVGIAAEKLSAAGYSQFRPVAGNDNEEGRRLNRRIEIVLAPLPVGQQGAQP